MAEFHFVEDYQNYVRGLMASHPIDEAMSLAVGGSYEKIGDIEADIVTYYGLCSDHAVVDLGCGSGRLAYALGKRMEIDYTGLDVVQELLDYAKTKCPENYNFVLNQTLTLPLPNHSVDYAFAFSVFTHLLHAETYLYLEEMFRFLKPGGRWCAPSLSSPCRSTGRCSRAPLRRRGTARSRTSISSWSESSSRRGPTTSASRR